MGEPQLETRCVRRVERKLKKKMLWGDNLSRGGNNYCTGNKWAGTVMLQWFAMKRRSLSGLWQTCQGLLKGIVGKHEHTEIEERADWGVSLSSWLLTHSNWFQPSGTWFSALEPLTGAWRHPASGASAHDCHFLTCIFLVLRELFLFQLNIINCIFF